MEPITRFGIFVYQCVFFYLASVGTSYFNALISILSVADSYMASVSIPSCAEGHFLPDFMDDVESFFKHFCWSLLFWVLWWNLLSYWFYFRSIHIFFSQVTAYVSFLSGLVTFMIIPSFPYYLYFKLYWFVWTVSCILNSTILPFSTPTLY